MRSSAALLVAAALLLSAAPADAAPTRLADAMAGAEAHWGGPPPCGRAAVEAWTRERLNAAAPPDEGLTTVGLTLFSRCAVAVWAAYVDPDRRPLGSLCALLAHELGHLRGLGHSADPRDLMADRPVGVPPACARAVRSRRARLRRERALRRAAPGPAARDRWTP